MIINSMTPFTLTDSAKQQMSSLLSKNPNKDAVSLSVKGGGCAGFQYEWGFLNDNQINDSDIIENWDEGKFVVDNTSLLYVTGTKIDWKVEAFGSHFEISNPSAKSSCGCGESFGV